VGAAGCPIASGETEDEKASLVPCSFSAYARRFTENPTFQAVSRRLFSTTTKPRVRVGLSDTWAQAETGKTRSRSELARSFLFQRKIPQKTCARRDDSSSAHLVELEASSCYFSSKRSYATGGSLEPHVPRSEPADTPSPSSLKPRSWLSLLSLKWLELGPRFHRHF
jgi:hypothetical protein